MEKQYKITDCNICPYLNMTEEEQREIPRGNHIMHWCNKYNKQVRHFGYDYKLIPCSECEVTYSFKDCTIGFWGRLNG